MNQASITRPARRHRLAAALCLGLASLPAAAVLPSHCRADEHAVLDAWMGPVRATESGWHSTRQGKLLSLCADRLQEPFSRLSYRYGVPGQPDLEVVASATAKFSIDSRPTSPHTGNDLVFFRRGPYTYYVAIATAQGTGVSLHVFKGASKVASHFSGNAAGTDYRLGPAEIDFDAPSPRSPVITRADAEHAF